MERGSLHGDDVSVVKEKIENIWNEILGVAEGRADATFFELGGQSITAMTITSRIEEELGLEADIGDLFEDPDIETFARIVSSQANAGSQNER